MFKTSVGGPSLDFLERYASSELDPTDHSGFLRICRFFRITDKIICQTDSELIEMFEKLKKVGALYGVDISHDFSSLLVQCRLREEAEKQEKENDRMEVELAKSRDRIAELYIRKIRLAELVKEKEALSEMIKDVEKDREYSDVSREVLCLAKSFGLATKKQSSGKAIFLKSDWNIEFHNYFMPFVNLSIETVNFIYEQIQNPRKEGSTGKEQHVIQLMNYYQKRIEAKTAYLQHKTPSNSLNYLIALILIEKRTLSVQNICILVKKNRQDIIKNIFYLSSEKILLFDRGRDLVSLYSTHR